MQKVVIHFINFERQGEIINLYEYCILMEMYLARSEWEKESMHAAFQSIVKEKGKGKTVKERSSIPHPHTKKKRKKE